MKSIKNNFQATTTESELSEGVSLNKGTVMKNSHIYLVTNNQDKFVSYYTSMKKAERHIRVIYSTVHNVEYTKCTDMKSYKTFWDNTFEISYRIERNLVL